MSNPELSLKPTQQWMQWSGPESDTVYVCDPTTGSPVCGINLDREPNEPPAPFVNDPWIEEGFTIWREGNELDRGVPNVGIYLTDPACSTGLNYAYFTNEVVPHFDVVGVAHWRSALQDERHQREHNRKVMETLAGSLATPNMPHPDYEEQLVQALGHKFQFSFDPSFHDHTTELQGVSAELVAAAREQLHELFSPREISSLDAPDVFAYGADIAYTNMLGWYMAGRAGQKLQELCEDENEGRLPNNVLLVLPVEHRDIARKLGVYSKIPAIEMVAADEQKANEFDFAFYGLAMQMENFRYQTLPKVNLISEAFLIVLEGLERLVQRG